MNAQELLQEISDYCRQTGLAESTFGRRAVNDGKLASRLRNGGRITTDTLDRIRAFMAANRNTPARTTVIARPPDRAPAPIASAAADPPRRCRRARSFTAAAAGPTRSAISASSTTGRNICCSSTPAARNGWSPTRRARARQHPSAPAGGARVRRRRRRRHGAGARDARDARPLSAHAVLRRRQGDQPRGRAAGAAEDVGPLLRASGDRAGADQPRLCRRAVARGQVAVGAASSMVWHEVPLAGDSAHQFEQQITELEPFLAENWKAGVSPKTGNPVYERPVVLVLYREDHRFLLDPIIPRPGGTVANYDLVIASQPYRARASLDFKAKRVIAPLARALGPGGRLIAIHSHGHDPGMEIIQQGLAGRQSVHPRPPPDPESGEARARPPGAISTSTPMPTTARCSATTCTRCRRRFPPVDRHLDAVRGLERRDLRGADRGRPARRRGRRRPLSRRHRARCCASTAACGSSTSPT